MNDREPLPGPGIIQDGEQIETFIAPVCGHEMLDESEITLEGLCVNCDEKRQTEATH